MPKHCFLRSKEMLYLTISNSLGVYVLVCPVLFTETYVVDGKPHM